MGKFLIYGLCDPSTKAVRYIGKSSCGMRRPRYHKYAAGKGDGGACANWIRSLLSSGSLYEIVVLEVVPDGDSLVDREVWWIAHGRKQGWKLLNQTDGGEGLPGYEHHAMTRAKLRDASLRQWSDPESRSRVVRSMFGRKVSSAGRAALSVSHMGLTQSAETRAKKSASLKGHLTSIKTREKIRAALKARAQRLGTKTKREKKTLGERAEVARNSQRKNWADPAYRAKHIEINRNLMTAERRASISASVKQLWLDPEYCERMRLAFRNRGGYHWSEGAKEKLRAALHKSWENPKRRAAASEKRKELWRTAKYRKAQALARLREK